MKQTEGKREQKEESVFVDYSDGSELCSAPYMLLWPVVACLVSRAPPVAVGVEQCQHQEWASDPGWATEGTGISMS